MKWGPCAVPNCQDNNCPVVEGGDPQWPVGCLCPQFHQNAKQSPYDQNGFPDFGGGRRAKKDTLRTTYNNRGRNKAAAILENFDAADGTDDYVGFYDPSGREVNSEPPDEDYTTEEPDDDDRDEEDEDGF